MSSLSCYIPSLVKILSAKICIHIKLSSFFGSFSYVGCHFMYLPWMCFFWGTTSLISISLIVIHFFPVFLEITYFICKIKGLLQFLFCWNSTICIRKMLKMQWKPREDGSHASINKRNPESRIQTHEIFSCQSKGCIQALQKVIQS